MRTHLARLPLLILILSSLPAQLPAAESRHLTVGDYLDKMKAGWIGQMAGVGQGAPTEFKFKEQIIPLDKVPKWKPSMINQFNQDDIYVEMTFLRTLEVHGMDVSIRQAGIDFANSGYRLWHANRFGRENLRKGIAPPDSGHPKFNAHADDIDYQIEADFSGLIAPGMPNVAIQLGEVFGRLMNYGDGLYGGQFVGGMYAAAFFENDPGKIVEAGLECIPAECQYAECIRDVLAWHIEYPDDFTKCWQLVEDKYQKNPDYRRFSCSKGAFNIDAKINGAYIVIGLLYGERDMDRTIVISTRCGQDSDCNPSNAAGILATTIGFSRLPSRYKSALDPEGKFSHTPYSFPELVEVCEKLVRQSVGRAGGRIEKNAAGQEVFVIPVREPKPSAFAQCWDPGPIADSRFTEAEMEQITALGGKRKVEKHLADKLPGWKLSSCGTDMDAPLVHAKWSGRKDVLMTHPLDRKTASVLSKRLAVPTGNSTALRLLVGHHADGDWDLVIKVDGRPVATHTVGAGTATRGWMKIEQDLAPFAGKHIRLELLNQPTAWRWEAAYWGRIEVVSE